MKTVLIELLNKNHAERQIYLKDNAEMLLENMVQHIGDPEDELRDKLVYRLFAELLSNGLWTNEQLAQLANTLKGEAYLFHAIGDRESDRVFTRSFSALWLSHLLNADCQLHFLSPAEAQDILDRSASYLLKEKDIRGFVNEKGWAHAIAHGADLAASIAAHPSFEMRFAPILLQGIKESFWKGSVYIDDEDERLVVVIEKLLAVELPEEIMIEWIEQVFDKLRFYLMEVGYTPHYFAARTNTLHFMKTLYFTLKFSQKSPELQAIISLFLAKWMKQ